MLVQIFYYILYVSFFRELPNFFLIQYIAYQSTAQKQTMDSM